MKKIYLLAMFCLTGLLVSAQNEILSPDYTLYEIDKTSGQIITNNPYTLSQYTDSGKYVVIDFFATWCTYCWQYVQTGNFESFYNQYGPNGTNEVAVFAIEGDKGNYAALSGTGPDADGYASQGNFLGAANYPVIPTDMAPNTTDILSDYSISAFPTFWMVCPSKWAYTINRGTPASMYSQITSKCPNFNTSASANAALFTNVKGFKSKYICEANATPVIKLQNVSENPMTSAELTITFDGATSTYNWTGNLAKYEWVEVELPAVQTSAHGSHTYSVAISKVNGVDDPDPLKNTASGSFMVQSTPSVTNVNATFSSSIPSNWTQDFGYCHVYSTNGALYFNAYSIPAGNYDYLNLPPLDITRYNTPVLKFDVSHRQYAANRQEILKVEYSNNCDDNWITIYEKRDPELATVSGYQSNQNFIPSTNQWRTEYIDLSGIENRSNIRFRFGFFSDYGQIIWLDNVRILDGTDVEEHDALNISLYPNPAVDMLHVNTPSPIDQILIYNIQGQLVRTVKGDNHSISLGDLANGIYTLKIMTDKGVSVQKVVKQ